jgi:hypothetical protein
MRPSWPHDTEPHASGSRLDEAERMQTPWFAAEYVRDAVYSWNPGLPSEGLENMSETVGEMVRGMAEASLEDALFAEAEERVIQLERSA